VLPEDEQIVSSAALTVEVEGVSVELAPGPNALDAAIRGAVHDDRLLSLFNWFRYVEQPELIPVGMRGFADGVAAAAEDADDWARAAVTKQKRNAKDLISLYM